MNLEGTLCELSDLENQLNILNESQDSDNLFTGKKKNYRLLFFFVILYITKIPK